MRRFNWTDVSRADWVPGWIILAGFLATSVPLLVDGVQAAWQVLRAGV